MRDRDLRFGPRKFSVCDQCLLAKKPCLWLGGNERPGIEAPCQGCQTDPQRGACRIQGRNTLNLTMLELGESLAQDFSENFKSVSNSLHELSSSFEMLSTSINTLAAAVGVPVSTDLDLTMIEESEEELASDADDPAVVAPDTSDSDESDLNSQQ